MARRATLGLIEPAWPDMVTLPVRRFRMGRPDGEEGEDIERPQREVTVDRGPSRIGRVAVTFAQWDAAMDAGFVPPRVRRHPGMQGWGRYDARRTAPGP